MDPSAANNVPRELSPARIDTDALEDYNPFQPPPESNVPVSGKIGDPTSTSAFNQPLSTFESQRIITEELERRQRELDAKAAELARREAEQSHMGARQSSGQPNNWPPLPKIFPCGPCFYQDIELEINPEYQTIVRYGYYLWMLYTALLIMNFIGSLVIFAGASSNGGTTFGLSILIACFCIPSSYICWFRPMYKAFRSDSSLNFFLFFFIFAAQILVMGIQTLGIENSGSCGWLVGLTLTKSDTGIGIFVLFIALMFTVMIVLSVIYIRQVHSIYRNTGASFIKARAELGRNVTTDPVFRGVVVDQGLRSFAGGN